MISSGSPAFTVLPMSTNGFAVGSGERYAVPTICDVTTPGCFAGSAGRGADVTAGAGATAGIGGTCEPPPAPTVVTPRRGAGGAGRGAPPPPPPATTFVTAWRATRTRKPSRSTSISPRPVSSSSFASSRIRSCSPKVPPGLCEKQLFRFGANQARQPLNGKRITLDAKAANDCLRAFRDVGVVAEFLALMNVGDVHFDGRDGSREDSIEDRNRSRGVACGIDDDPGNLLRLRLVKPVDDFALAVGLTEVDLQSIAFGRLAAQL